MVESFLEYPQLPLFLLAWSFEVGLLAKSIIADRRFLLLVGMEQNLQVDELKLAEIGPKFENHVVFPARTNTG